MAFVIKLWTSSQHRSALKSVILLLSHSTADDVNIGADTPLFISSSCSRLVELPLKKKKYMEFMTKSGKLNLP